MQILKTQQAQSWVDDYSIRKEVSETFAGFCLVYLSHYFTIEPADFHAELLGILGDHDERFVDITGFRGSAKSTFASLALPLWMALKHPDKYQFIIPLADTGMQSAINIANIKYELENNSLILQDFGKFKYKKIDDPSPEPTLESDEEWQAKNMLLDNGVRILARSRGQKIRGLRHRQYRPKAVIGDDLEDLDWVRQKENRDKTERWFRGEVLPAIDDSTGRAIIIGNHLHADALMARLRKDRTFKHLEYPLVRTRKDGTQEITWKAKYPNQQALDDLKDRVKVVAYMREYLLKVVPEDGQVIKPEWIKYYDKLPAEQGLFGTGVDLAISKKDTADCTAMVSASSHAIPIPKIYVRPNPINARLSFNETIETAKAITIANPFGILFVEQVGYQQSAIEEMERQMLPVQAMKPTTSDKRARLQSVAPYIQNGTVMFAREGCEDLIIQLLGFGVEEHDDLCLNKDTLVLTRQGNIPICDVRIGDEVMTRKGYKKVLMSGQTGIKETIENIGIIGTPDHPVFTTKGIKELQYINATDIIYIWNERLSCIEERNITDIQNQKNVHTEFITGRTQNGKKDQSLYTVKNISTNTEKSPREWWCIIKMKIRSTIDFAISSLCRVENICPYISQLQKGKNNQESKLKKSEDLHRSGTNQRQVGNGTESTQKNNGKILKHTNEFASDAKKNSLHTTKTQYPAPQRVDTGYICKKGKQPVFNLTVADENEFFANGILVHNCDAMVYVILGLVQQGLEAPVAVDLFTVGSIDDDRLEGSGRIK